MPHVPRTLLLVALAAACHRAPADGPSPAAGAPGAAGATPPPAASSDPRSPAWSALTFVRAAAAPPHWTDDLPGRIAFDETRTSRLGTSLGGRVTQVWVERGQHVEVGARLFEVASADLASLRADLDKALLEAETARTNLGRVQALVDGKSLPAKELARARLDQAEADLAVKTARDKLRSLKVNAGGNASFVVTAPRAGVVVEKNLVPGQQVAPESGALVAIADVTDVWVFADLLEDAVGGIAPGVQAEISLDGDPARRPGVVEQVSAIVDPDRHTVPVRVKLANPSGGLRPGAFAQVRFFDAHPVPVSVPASAVLSDGARHYVYVRRDGHLARQDVSAAPASAGVVAIRAGLAVGDEVVAQGAALLDNQLLD
jgi:RND family efflux transporter MFP subunit